MGSLILVVAIISIIINIGNLSTSNSNRIKKVQEAEKELKSFCKDDKEFFSKANKKEIELLNGLYNRGFLNGLYKDFSNTEFITISGKYNESILVRRSRMGTTRKTIRYIGNFEIIFAGIYNLEMGKNYSVRGAIYKDKLYVLGIKEKPLQENKSKNDKIPKLKIVEDMERILSLETIRYLKISENLSLTMPVVLFGMGIIPTSIAVLIESEWQLYFMLFSLLIMTAVTIYIAKERIPVYALEGIVKKREKRFYVNDIMLSLENEWYESIRDGEFVKLEAYKEVGVNAYLKVVKFNENSLEIKHTKFNLKKLLWYVIALLIYGVFIFGALNGSNYKYYKNILSRRDTREKFTSYNEIKNYDFFVNQHVKFKNIKTFIANGFDDNVYILDENMPINNAGEIAIKRFETRVDMTNDLLNDYKNKKADFLEEEKYKEYREMKRYNKLKLMFKDQPNWKTSEEANEELDHEVVYLAKDYLEKLNDDVKNWSKYLESNMKKNIVVHIRNYDRNNYKYRYLGYTLLVQGPNLKELLYGKNRDIEGTITKVSNENGVLKLDITQERKINYVKSAKLITVAIFIYRLIFVVLFLFLIREIFRFGKDINNKI